MLKIFHEPPARPPDDDPLSGQVRAGDRTAAAAFLQKNEPLLRRRFRHKISAALRRVVDSEDLVSTVARRLDAYVASGRLSGATQEQLWAVVVRIAHNSLMDKLRVLQRLESAERNDRVLAQSLRRHLQGAEDGGELERRVEDILRLLGSEVDREIVRLWLHGAEAGVIADDLGMTPEAVRKRWERIKVSLRVRLGAA